MRLSLALLFILIAVCMATGVEGNMEQIKPVVAELREEMKSRRLLLCDDMMSGLSTNHGAYNLNPSVIDNTDTATDNDIGSWKAHVGMDYHGNDIVCGEFDDFWQIKDACAQDSNCVGFSVWNCWPWCLKKGMNGRYSLTDRPDHTFYSKP